MLNISSFNQKKITVIPSTKYKIVFVGNQGVGKSSIINRLVYDIFDENDHVMHPIKTETNHRHRLHHLQYGLLRQMHQVATMGYSRTVKVSIINT